MIQFKAGFIPATQRNKDLIEVGAIIQLALEKGVSFSEDIK